MMQYTTTDPTPVVYAAVIQMNVSTLVYVGLRTKTTYVICRNKRLDVNYVLGSVRGMMVLNAQHVMEQE